MKRTLLIVQTMLLAACAGSEELVRASDCTRPGLIAAGQPIGKLDADRLNAENRAYRDCVKSYVSREKAIAEKYRTIANAHATAANVVIAELNQYALDLGSNLDERESIDATMP